jgi:hypothetical protein
MAKNAPQPNGGGVQNGNHCRPYSAYISTPVVKTAAQTGEFDHSWVLAYVALDMPASVVTTLAQPAELNTGPRPTNLVVELHRFLI